VVYEDENPANTKSVVLVPRGPWRPRGLLPGAGRTDEGFEGKDNSDGGKDGVFFYPSEAYPKFRIEPFMAAPKVTVPGK